KTAPTGLSNGKFTGVVTGVNGLPVVIRLGSSNVTAFALSEITRILLPSGLGTRKWAPGIPIVAVIAPLEILILPTPPGDACPATGTLGTAINAVVLSVQTNMLSVEPGRVIVRATLSCALLTMARPLLAGLKTNVRS